MALCHKMMKENSNSPLYDNIGIISQKLSIWIYTGFILYVINIPDGVCLLLLVFLLPIIRCSMSLEVTWSRSRQEQAETVPKLQTTTHIVHCFLLCNASLIFLYCYNVRYTNITWKIRHFCIVLKQCGIPLQLTPGIHLASNSIIINL